MLAAESAANPKPAAPSSRVVCSKDEPTECSVGLEIGEPAPFQGQLLTPPLALRLGMAADSFEDRVNLEVRHATDVQRLTFEHELRLKNIDLELSAKRIGQLENQLAEAEPPFYARPWFVIPVTTAGTVLLIWLASAVASNFSN